jgi:L-ascorbate metabolism protein UlaG (beta-lactamase superfamily)
MSAEIRWIGHASFRIASEGCVLYIDPWKIPTEPHDADVIFISHSHSDHCSPPDIERVSKADTTVVAPPETVAKIGKANAITPDELYSICNITIEPVEAYNMNKAFHPRGNNWCGAVFTMGGRRVYYAGDTDLIPAMSDLKNVDLALLPVGGTYTLNAEEAALACKAIGCAAAIPYHYGDVVGTEDDAKEFAKLAKCKVHVLTPGKRIII